MRRRLILLIGLSAFGLAAAGPAAARVGLSWGPRRHIGRRLRDISCPTTRFCAIVDGEGDVLTSTDPGGGRRAWHSTRVTPAATGGTGGVLHHIACPSVSLCVATSDDEVYESTDPTGGAGTWHAQRLDTQGFGLEGLACPRADLCLVADQRSWVYVSTDPAAGRWSVRRFGGLVGIDSLTCSAGAPPTTCVLTGSGDGSRSASMLTSEDPAGAAAGWRTTTGSGVVFGDGACPTARECVLSALHGPAGGDATDITVSTDAARGLPSYHLRRDARPGRRANVTSPACLSATACVAIGFIGEVVTGDPLAGRWRARTVDPHSRILAIACPSATMCLAVDDNGRVIAGHVS